MTEVVLVDGVGRPRVVTFSEALDVLEFAHPYVDPKQRRVKWFRQDGVALDGRPVYRMEWNGLVPMPRIRGEYLIPFVPFNPPRAEV